MIFSNQISCKLVIALTFGLFCLLSNPANSDAAVVDAPHTPAHGVNCGDCHAYSLWWHYSPAKNSTVPYAKITDGVCDNCHAVGGPQFNKIAHSASTMMAAPSDVHNPLTGNWSTACIDCHNPHLQPQLIWHTESPVDSLDYDAAPVYLIKGTLTQSVNPISVTNTGGVFTSTFEYEAANAPTGSKWLNPVNPPPPLGPWFSKTTSGRGLIVVINPNDPENTYEIVNATGNEITAGAADGFGTITVQGQINTTTFGSGNIAFGIIYGQLLKANIDTPHGSSRPVKFYNGKQTDNSVPGGFVETGNSTPTGICQVCHTLTDYWLEDGTIINTPRFPDPPYIVPPSDHNTGNPCTYCHYSSLGFKPNDADHTFMSASSTTCANCHLAAENIVQDTHKGQCNYCHSNPPTLHGSISDALGNLLWPTDPHTPGNCYNCHDNNGPAGSNSATGQYDDIASDFTNHPKALDSDNDSTNGLDGHEGQLASTPRCVTACHFHKNKDLVTEIHTFNPNSYDSTPSDPDPCSKCHDLQIQLAGSYSAAGTKLLTLGSYSGSGKLIGSAINGQGECIDCHDTIGESWQFHPYTGAHINQVYSTGTNLCTRCHIFDETKPNKSVTTVHTNNCNSCHEEDQEGVLVSLADLNGPGDCVNCHGSIFFLHKTANFVTFNHETYGLVTPEPVGSSPQCMTCHNEGSQNPGGADMIHDVHGEVLIGLQVPNPNFNACAFCHDDQGYLIGSASGHGLADLNGNPNTCSTCHAGKTVNHPQHSDVGDGMNGSVMPTDSCVSCHVGERTGVVHNTNTNGEKCLLCHQALFRDQIAVLRPGLPDPYTYGDADGHLECIECHTELDSSFFSADSRIDGDLLGHSKDSDHAGKVDIVPGCANCHSGDPLYDIHWGSGLCTGCHAQNGILLGSASQHGTGKPPVGVDNDCVTCHGTFSLHSSLPIGLSHGSEITRTPSQSCSIAGCHTESTSPEELVNIHDANGCYTCHSPNGDLIAPAVPLGGDCQDCHTTYFDGHTHGTSSHSVSEGGDESQDLNSNPQPCAYCHHDVSWSGILSRHDINTNGGCATCHESSRATNVKTPYTDVPDVILVGSTSTPITCLDCHENTVTYGHYCGNDTLNSTFGGEECDNGILNSDTTADACRTNCQSASCGDDVIDTGEVCDEGINNSQAPDASCRTDCTPQVCGDTIIDSLAGETCDDGGLNSDTAPDACRTDCTLPICGDDVVDAGYLEICDNGLLNSDTTADACRTDCTPAVCGDNVIDSAETCDNGLLNSDTTADACRTDCTPAVCGDNVIDTGETCDDGNTTPGDGCDDICQTE